MFEDIITEKEKKTTRNRNCDNCEYSSTILSTDLPRLYCSKREMHVDKMFYCGIDYYGKFSVHFGI
jgi:ribosomal protein S27AE